MTRNFLAVVVPAYSLPEVLKLASIFISYTSRDRDWAFWIGQELYALGHTPHIDAWEISGGGDIAAWMEQAHSEADHILCVVSKAHLKMPYASWERRAAAASESPVDAPDAP
jgi:hypothetical protein